MQYACVPGTGARTDKEGWYRPGSQFHRAMASIGHVHILQNEEFWSHSLEGGPITTYFLPFLDRVNDWQVDGEERIAHQIDEHVADPEHTECERNLVGN